MPTSTRTARTRTVRVLAAAGLTAAALLSSTAPAHAAGRDGHCDDGEFCYFYNSGNAGAVSDFTTSVSDYGTTQPGCYEFKGSAAGAGQCIKNNAASVWNRTSGSVTVYYNTGYDGATDVVDKGYKGQLSSTLYNQNASHKLGGTSTSRTALSYGLYKQSGGRITCGFDGYTTTSGRHEGIDIARSLGSPVRALVSGTVTYVAQGSRGSGGLSTIAIYNASYGKTVIYLHSNPGSLSVGQSISKGQQIAVEDYRGVSSAGSAHTHVEMRPGRQTHASVSVGDPHLDNPDPTSFWHTAGYDER